MGRQKTLDEMAKIFAEGIDNISKDPQLALEGTCKKLKSAVHSRIYTFVSPQLETAKSKDEIEKCMRRMFKDVKSATVSPIKKSHNGLNGLHSS